ncbi:MAG TPA: hypothetical protein VHF58_02880 [Solirubrobacterales bacterium]|nr:hypothetical protein [Solirubrobacterales bacterium]
MRMTITRISGDPKRLRGAYEQTADAMAEVGRDHGLLLHAAAETEDGFLMLNLWPSADGSESASRDRRRLDALRASGVAPEEISKEHYEVTNLYRYD